MADAKLAKSERVVDGGNDMASVLEDGGWKRVRLSSSAMVVCFSMHMINVSKSSELVNIIEEKVDIFGQASSHLPDAPYQPPVQSICTYQPDLMLDRCSMLLALPHSEII